MENEKCCSIPEEEHTVNNYLKQNSCLIYEILEIVGTIKDNIFGYTEEEKIDQNPASLIQILDVQNYNLKDIQTGLLKIRNTLTAK